MYPSVIRSAMHAATRCALAITALLLGINLRNITFEEENKRGSLHFGLAKVTIPTSSASQVAVQNTQTTSTFAEEHLTSPGTTLGTVPSYFELDVRIGWHVTKNLEISIVGQNLLHDQHAEYGFPSPTREEIQRSVYGKVAWQF